LLLFTVSAPGLVHAEPDAARVARLFMWASDGNVRHKDLVDPAKDSLGQMGAKAAPWLAKKLTTSDARERLMLADIFEKMGKVATPFIVPYLDSVGEDMPRNAARCLERIKDTSAVIPLLAQMDHPEYSVRSQVAAALGKTGDIRSADSLTRHLFFYPSDSDSDVRKSCAAALGLLHHDSRTVSSAELCLYHALNDSCYGVRQAALVSLLSLKMPEHLRYEKWFPSPVSTVWDHGALLVLGSLTKPEGRRPLLAVLNDPDYHKRGFAVEGLAIFHDKTAQIAIAKLKKRETDPFVLAQIARFEQIVLEKKNEQSKSK